MWARPDGASRDAKGEPVALKFACQATQVTQGTSVSAKPGRTDIYARIPGSRPFEKEIYIFREHTKVRWPPHLREESSLFLSISLSRDDTLWGGYD